jgi:hypothetical protein
MYFEKGGDVKLEPGYRFEAAQQPQPRLQKTPSPLDNQ